MQRELLPARGCNLLPGHPPLRVPKWSCLHSVCGGVYNFGEEPVPVRVIAIYLLFIGVDGI